MKIWLTIIKRKDTMSVKIVSSINKPNKKCKKRIGGGQIYEKIEGCFYLSCLMVTLVLSISCCIEYSKNDDVTQISVKPFGMKEVVAYPEISFCLEDYDIFTLSSKICFERK